MILCTLIEEDHFAVSFYWKRIPPAKLIWSKRALNMRAVIIGSIVTFPCSCCKLWKCQTSRLTVAILACVINWTSHSTHTIEVYPSAPRSAGEVGLSINVLALRQSATKYVLIFTMWASATFYFKFINHLLPSSKHTTGKCLERIGHFSKWTPVLFLFYFKLLG